MRVIEQERRQHLTPTPPIRFFFIGEIVNNRGTATEILGTNHRPIQWIHTFKLVTIQPDSIKHNDLLFTMTEMVISHQFSDLKNIELISLECGNFCVVSARLSLKRHYPLPYYFQISFLE